MSTEIVVALLSLVGTAIGSGFGIITANRLTNYRIQQLEIKVDKHNSVIKRVYSLESKMESVEEDIHEIKEALK